MTVVLLIVLIAVPLLEIAVMIKVGSWIGFWPSLAIVVGTFMVGASVLARSGLTAAFRVQEAMLKGEAPVAAMVEGALVATAGIFLATPGFVADICGLLLLVPPIRRFVARWTADRVFATGNVHVSGTHYEASERAQGQASGPDPGDGGKGGPIIDGEFERLDERPMGQGRSKRERPDGGKR